MNTSTPRVTAATRALLTAQSSDDDSDSDEEKRPELLHSAPPNKPKAVTRRAVLDEDAASLTSTSRSTRSKRNASVVPAPEPEQPKPKRARRSKIVESDEDDISDQIAMSEPPLVPDSPPRETRSKKRKSRDGEQQSSNGWDGVADELPTQSSPPEPPAAHRTSPFGVPQPQKVVMQTALKQQRASKINVLTDPSLTPRSVSSSSSSASFTEPVRPISPVSAPPPAPLSSEQLAERSKIEAFADSLIFQSPNGENTDILRRKRVILKNDPKFALDEARRAELKFRLSQVSVPNTLSRKLGVALQSIDTAGKTGKVLGALSIDQSEQIDFLADVMDFLVYAYKEFQWSMPSCRDIKQRIIHFRASLQPHATDEKRHWQNLYQKIYDAAKLTWYPTMPDLPTLTPPVPSVSSSSRQIPRVSMAASAQQYRQSKQLGSSSSRPATASTGSASSHVSDPSPRRPLAVVTDFSGAASLNSSLFVNKAGPTTTPLKSALRTSTGEGQSARRKSGSVKFPDDDKLEAIRYISPKAKKSSARSRLGEPDAEPVEDNETEEVSLDAPKWVCLQCQLSNPPTVDVCQHCQYARASLARAVIDRPQRSSASPAVVDNRSSSPSSFVVAQPLPPLSVSSDPAPSVDHVAEFQSLTSPASRAQHGSQHIASSSSAVALSQSPRNHSPPPLTNVLVRPHLSLLQCLRDTGELNSPDQPAPEAEPLSPQDLPPPLEAVPDYNEPYISAAPLYAPVLVNIPQGEPDHPMPNGRNMYSQMVLPGPHPPGFSSAPAPAAPVVHVAHVAPAAGQSTPPPASTSLLSTAPMVKREKPTVPSKPPGNLDDARYAPPDLPDFPFASTPIVYDSSSLPNSSSAPSSSVNVSPHTDSFVSSVVGVSGGIPVSDTEGADEERRKRRLMLKEQRELVREQQSQPTQKPLPTRKEVKERREIQEMNEANIRKQRRARDLALLQTRKDDFRMAENKKENEAKPKSLRPSSLL